MPPPPNTPQSNANANPNPPPTNASAFLATVLNPPTTASRTPPHLRMSSNRGGQSEFTATQRSLQARNKPYEGAAATREGEAYETRQRREEAASILQNLEMLIWYSSARNESLSQTRHHFQNVVLGVDRDDDIQWLEEWEVPPERRVRKDGEDTVMGGGSGSSPARSAKGKEREKGKRKA
ncbi:hypothetical protein BU26DRAFT_513767 [Trematosphaeria pertusa]|uniref:Uncharacterized protein n=1 Tax=Trematosphaeria pertusa TaxID=390896 RepID=A0A6A6J2I3_9PLEO|nr:uncharacterized protein BU26DRAFT_513767 [Trematosphaeria pertusa]KAF2257044.1 hypothetical protein BU26DRAFT_513767 [Trematosphaeria pertusa]